MNESETLTKASYRVAYVLAESDKPFTDGEVAKECLLEVSEERCPEKSNQFKNVALGANTIARRVANMGENIVTQTVKNASKFHYFSIAIDESQDICSTSQLLVFIRGVDEDMNITQELASLHSVTLVWYSMRESECELKNRHALTMCVHLIPSYYESIVRWLDRTLSQETM